MSDGEHIAIKDEFFGKLNEVFTNMENSRDIRILGDFKNKQEN